MVSFKCDDKDVERCLKKLERQIVCAGGWLHDDVTICSQNGNLSIETSLPSESKDVIIHLSAECLLPVEQVQLSLSGDELCLADNKSNLPAEQMQIFETHIELFNLTGKISDYKKNSIWVNFAHSPEMLERLVSKGKIQQYNAASSKNIEEFLINDFINTRIISIEIAPNIRQKFMMPFIDCVNNNPDATGFNIGRDKTGYSTVEIRNSRPVTKSQECFVNYGYYDAYCTYRSYGYVEQNPPFIRSIPIIIQLADIGAINIKAQANIQIKEKLPSELSGLELFMPSITPRPQVTEISHLIIPRPHAPHALRRILVHLIRTLSTSFLTDKDITNYVKKAEADVVSLNIKFYTDLQEYLENCDKESFEKHIIDMTEKMIQVQLSMLNEYVPMQ